MENYLSPLVSNLEIKNAKQAFGANLILSIYKQPKGYLDFLLETFKTFIFLCCEHFYSHNIFFSVSEIPWDIYIFFSAAALEDCLRPYPLHLL